MNIATFAHLFGRVITGANVSLGSDYPHYPIVGCSRARGYSFAVTHCLVVVRRHKSYFALAYIC
jgi:hypothetical protein